jgi:hypothetical protein
MNNGIDDAINGLLEHATTPARQSFELAWETALQQVPPRTVADSRLLWEMQAAAAGIITVISGIGITAALWLHGLLSFRPLLAIAH